LGADAVARRQAKEKIDIDVVPYLSIMVIVLKLLSLILIVVVLRIAVNPLGRRIVSLNLFTSRGAVVSPKEPTYIDCWPDKWVIYPGEANLPVEEIWNPNNILIETLDKVSAKKDKEYVVVMIRPGAVKTYRMLRPLIDRRGIEVGKDVVDASFKVNWDAAVKALAVVEEE
jgi:hypothetical protein